MRTLRGGLWVWVGILVFFLILGVVLGNGKTAWQVTQYVVLSAFVLVLLVALISGFAEMRRSRGRKRDD